MISKDGVVILTQKEYDELYDSSCDIAFACIKKDKEIREMKQKVIALIKDGRFVEALQELENEI